MLMLLIRFRKKYKIHAAFLSKTTRHMRECYRNFAAAAEAAAEIPQTALYTRQVQLFPVPE